MVEAMRAGRLPFVTRAPKHIPNLQATGPTLERMRDRFNRANEPSVLPTPLQTRSPRQVSPVRPAPLVMAYEFADR